MSEKSIEEQVSWMSVADEGTTSHLQATVYSCSQVSEINEQQALQDINECFKEFGMPENIKIDNGRPFVNPNNRDVPTKSILWWVGLGIKVIQNPPRTPQDNGAVENLQGTLSCWTNPSSFDCIKDFQNRVNIESKFQRESYKIPAKGYKTRKELFPGLETNQQKRKFTNELADKLFDIQNVYDFLSEKVWKRRIRKKGDCKFMASYFYISKQNAYQTVYITFDPIDKQWIFRDENGKLLKTSSKKIPLKEEIKKFAIMSKN